MRLLQDAVEADGMHTRALNDLAVLHIQGLAGSKSPKLQVGLELLRRSADLGLAPAIFNLAICLDDGIGCVQDPQAAFDLYRAAARQVCQPPTPHPAPHADPRAEALEPPRLSQEALLERVPVAGTQPHTVRVLLGRASARRSTMSAWRIVTAAG